MMGIKKREANFGIKLQTEKKSVKQDQNIICMFLFMLSNRKQVKEGQSSILSPAVFFLIPEFIQLVARSSRKSFRTWWEY